MPEGRHTCEVCGVEEADRYLAQYVEGWADAHRTTGGGVHGLYRGAIYHSRYRHKRGCLEQTTMFDAAAFDVT